MNILLHICCAPCAISAADEIKKDGHLVGGFFYNPNIHPYSEYLKRKGEVEKYSRTDGLTVTYGDYDLGRYFEYVSYDPDLKKRCPACWWLRLDKAAKFALENGFDAFTTTLLGSPYLDQNVIKNIGEEIANKIGIKFFYKDFRPNFRSAHDRARKEGIYCQNYCGCLFSEMERIESKASGKKDRK